MMHRIEEDKLHGRIPQHSHRDIRCKTFGRARLLPSRDASECWSLWLNLRANAQRLICSVAELARVWWTADSSKLWRVRLRLLGARAIISDISSRTFIAYFRNISTYPISLLGDTLLLVRITYENHLSIRLVRALLRGADHTERGYRYLK